MFSDPLVGNSECSACHGGGFGTFFDPVSKEFLSREPLAWDECYGTGKCQTCGRTGMFEEAEIKIAAEPRTSSNDPHHPAR